MIAVWYEKESIDHIIWLAY